MRPWRSRKPWRCWRALPSTRIAVARALTRSRMASCAASGTQTAVSSPARCSLASITASRRSVLTRSPAFIGISEGATTMQSCPSSRQLPMQAITAGAGLVAKAQPSAALGQLLRQLGDLIGAIGDDPQVADFAAPHPFGHRNRNRRLVDIQPYENVILHQARSPCLRLGAGPSGAILDRSLPWGGPPVTSGREHRV